MYKDSYLHIHFQSATFIHDVDKCLILIIPNLIENSSGNSSIVIYREEKER